MVYQELEYMPGSHVTDTKNESKDLKARGRRYRE